MKLTTDELYDLQKRAVYDATKNGCPKCNDMQTKINYLQDSLRESQATNRDLQHALSQSHEECKEFDNALLKMEEETRHLRMKRTEEATR